MVEIQSPLYGHVLWSSYILPILYSYCNPFFIRDFHGEFGLINAHFFDILRAVLSRKENQGLFSVWRVLTV